VQVLHGVNELVVVVVVPVVRVIVLLFIVISRLCTFTIILILRLIFKIKLKN